ncbi:MAG: helix-turn-helix transcriptional regulator [Clostridia bacterium]|nr:helix-turn-helix transcriptional regulator [Clostridia bacterium]
MDKVVEELRSKIPPDEEIRRMCSDYIIEWAKSVRASYDTNQGDFAKKIGFSRATVAQWESGIRLPTVEHYMTLSKWFEVSISQLVGMTDDKLLLGGDEHSSKRKQKEKITLDLSIFNEKGRYFIENVFYMMSNYPPFLKNPQESSFSDDYFDMFED